MDDEVPRLVDAGVRPVACRRQAMLAGINLVVAACAAWVLLGQVSSWALAGWSALIVVPQAVRIVWALRGAIAEPLEGRAATTFSFLAGLAWGVGGALFHGVPIIAGMGLMPFLVTGMTAGAAISLANHLPSFFAFCVPAVLVYASAVIIGGDPGSLGVAVFALLYLLGIGLIAVQVNRELRERDMLGRENALLVDKLDDARVELEATVERRTRELRDSNFRLSAEIATRRRSEERIRHLLEHDSLTDLPNRRFLMRWLGDALHEADAHGAMLGVMMLDLDRFKEVNDTLGHPAGDMLLRQAAARLQASAGPDAIVARMGGDEFAIVTAQFAAPQDAALIAERLLQAFQEPFELSGGRAMVLTSIGVAVYPESGVDGDTLLSHADQALYEAKSFGRGRYSLHSEELQAQHHIRRQLGDDLERALDEDQFELRFQPRYALDGRNLVATEALLRWRHPTLGVLPPAEFLPLAETTGRIGAIGRWVMKQSCRQARMWMDKGLSTRIAVNLSITELQQHDIARQILQTLDDAELPPERLELEISEEALARGGTPILRDLRRMKGLGVRLVLDDFGAGGAALGLVKSLPFDALKVERRFVSRMQSNRGDMAVVKSVITLARELGWTSIAEGVEDDSQLDALMALGCDEAQGFLLGQPLPITELEPVLAA